MPSLNLDLDYFDHPKTKRLVRLLGKGSEVLPLKVWVYAARYFPKDGKLAGISTQEIESECRWWGNEGEMVRVMLLPDVAFLEKNGATLAVHDWREHEGHLAVFNERAKKGAKARWNKYASRSASSIPSSNTPTIPAEPTKPTNLKIIPPKADGESENYRAFTDFWVRKFQEAMGYPYPDDPKDKSGWATIAALWRKCGRSIDLATAALSAFIDDPYWRKQGLPLSGLRTQASKYIAEAHKKGTAIGHGNREILKDCNIPG